MVKRLIKTILYMIIITLILIFLIFCFELPSNHDTNNIQINSQVRSVGNPKQDMDYTKYTNEGLFEIIEDAMVEGRDSIKIDNSYLKDEEFLSSTIERVLMANPEIMYYRGARYGNGTLIFDYSKPREERILHRDTIRRERQKIIREKIRAGMSDYEKVKIIHDYIVGISKYDERYLRNEEVPEESHTVYGVLNKGIALCGGYSKAIKYLLDETNIESIIVIGQAGNDNHAWNIVKIDGHYYHLDATWNDPIREDGSNTISYNYFNLKDGDIEKSHNWNRADYPQCNSDKHNYYYYNGFVVDNYNDFYGRVKLALLDKDQILELKVLNFNKNIYDIPDTINMIVDSQIKLVGIKKYKYIINDEQGIIKIEFEYAN